MQLKNPMTKRAKSANFKKTYRHLRRNEPVNKAETQEVFPPKTSIFGVRCQQQPCKLFYMSADTKTLQPRY